MNSENSAEHGTQKARGEGREPSKTGEVSAGAVEIQGSETGKDTNVGHTPGKAEGVDSPETEGNR